MSLRKRTIVSFAVLMAAWSGAYGLWRYTQSIPTDDEISPVLRRVLDANGALWSTLSHRGVRATGTAPPEGKKPRTNGLIGLNGEFDVSKWSMEVDPNDADPDAESFDVTMAEIRALPRVDTATEFRCIEGWNDQIAYAGVRFSDFIRYYHLGAHKTKDWSTDHPPRDLFRYVGLETPDGEYYVSIDMESMLHDQTVLAYEMNGKPLSPDNGAPLRLIIPVKYGIKHLKRIGRIFFSDTRPPDYWQERGYDWFAGL